MLFFACSGLEKSLPQTRNMLAYIVETENHGSLGRDVIFHASKEHPVELEVRRLDWIFANSLLPYQRPFILPSVLMVPVQNEKPQWYVRLFKYFCRVLFIRNKPKRTLAPERG